MVFDTFFNTLFGWAITLDPLLGVSVVAASLTFITTIVYKYATDQHALKTLREELQRLQAEMKQEKDNPKKVMELQKTMFQKNMESMKHNLKPMIITFLPVILVFNWMRTTFTPFGKILFGYIGWLGTYIILTLILSIILRKLLKVY